MGLMLAVPEVMGHRLLGMWLAGPAPSKRDRDEFHRMWTEKPLAFYASWNAMMLEMLRANLRLAWMPWTLPTLGATQAHGRRSAARIVAAGLGPIHRRVAANAKRLRKLR